LTGKKSFYLLRAWERVRVRQCGCRSGVFCGHTYPIQFHLLPWIRKARRMRASLPATSDPMRAGRGSAAASRLDACEVRRDASIRHRSPCLGRTRRGTLVPIAAESLSRAFESDGRQPLPKQPGRAAVPASARRVANTPGRSGRSGNRRHYSVAQTQALQARLDKGSPRQLSKTQQIIAAIRNVHTTAPF
jgi:hypothetical protein